MKWVDFYKQYSDLDDATLRKAIMSLYDIGMGDEVAEAVDRINNAEIRMRLVERAMELDAIFTQDDIVILDNRIPSPLLVKLIKYGNLELGDADDITSAVENIFDRDACRALYERAYIEDVKFTSDHLDRMGYEDIDSAHDVLPENNDAKKSTAAGCGCLGLLLGLGIISELTKKKSRRKR